MPEPSRGHTALPVRVMQILSLTAYEFLEQADTNSERNQRTEDRKDHGEIRS